MSIFPAMSFDLDKRAAESVVNFAGMDIISIAYKRAAESVGGEWERVPIEEQIKVFP